MGKTIEHIRAKAAEHYNGAEGFDNAARKNAYECENCASYIVTVDREPGVTPFIVGCGNCGAMAQSKFYRVQAYLDPTHEWYRPDTLAGIKGGVREHVENGGLLLRQIGGGDQKEGWQKPDTAMADAKRETEALASMFERKIREANSANVDDRLAALEANIAQKMKAAPQVKREDYPSRQAFRHAQTQHRKGRLP